MITETTKLWSDDRNFYHPEDDIRLGSEKKKLTFMLLAATTTKVMLMNTRKRTDEDFFVRIQFKSG